jgi:hypothetical protein
MNYKDFPVGQLFFLCWSVPLLLLSWSLAQRFSNRSDCETITGL